MRQWLVMLSLVAVVGFAVAQDDEKPKTKTQSKAKKADDGLELEADPNALGKKPANKKELLDKVKPFLESVDLAVVMTIEAGAADSPILPESLEKIKSLRHHFPDLPIVAEGNIDQRNAKLLTDVGASRLVVSADTLTRNGAAIASTLQELQGT